MNRAEAVEAIRTGEPVKATYLNGPGVHCRGRVIGYYDKPTIIIETEGGAQVAWLAGLVQKDES